MKKDAFYFPHDSNAKDDPKCVLLIEQLGLEGYGIYWVLIEVLREQPNYRYPMKLIPALARRYNTTVEKVKTVVASYGLFNVENDEFFFSESLERRMLPLEEKRNRMAELGRKSAEARKLIVQRTFSARSTYVQPVKKSKEEKSINKESRKKVELSLPDRQKLFQEELNPFVEKYGIDLIQKFYVYWAEPTQTGTKMRRELQKTWSTAGRLSTWARKEVIYEK